MIAIEQQTYVMIPSDKIVDRLKVRRVSPSGKKRIRGSIHRSGYLKNNPLIVKRLPDGNYLLIDGNHRKAAGDEEGVTEYPCIVVTDMTEPEMFKLALESNNAAETVVPSTLVTNAEFVWQRVSKGCTHEEIGEMMKWHPDKVTKYNLLNQIREKPWEVIVTTFENTVSDNEEEGVTSKVTGVIFTENLLRDILSLTSEQQLELVTEFAHPNKDKRITKSAFKTRAENYQARNEAYDYAKQQLGELGEDYLSRVHKEVYSGAYDDEWKKSVDKKKKEYGLHPKLDRLIKAIHDEWEEKNSIHIIHGDYYEEVLKVGTGSIDLILTDPPYNIANARVFSLDGRSNRSQDFGPWDRYHRSDFIDLFPQWAREWARILRDNGCGFVFTSYIYASYLVAALEEAGLHVKEMLDWCKTNPGTQIEHTTFRSSIEHILYFTKGKGEHTFHWQGENEMLTYFHSPICQGKERLENEKNKTLHATQKPERVIAHLMNISSNRGDMIFDGFAGVMTVAKVAKDLGRKCICIEQDTTYYEAGKRRVEHSAKGD